MSWHRSPETGRGPSIFLIISILAGSVVGCGDATITQLDPHDAKSTTIQRLILEPHEVTIHVADAVQFVAYGVTASGDTTTVELTWSTTDGTLDTKGQGKGKGVYKSNKPGKNKVIATDSSGVADTAVVTVSDPVVARVDVTPAEASVSVGSSVQLVATPVDDKGNTLTDLQVAWSSERPSIAGVDGQGRVTGTASGSTVVTATVGGRSGSAAITVLATAALSGAFSCLSTATDVQSVTGHYEAKYEPDAARGRAFDARAADFVVREKWGTIAVGGSSAQTGMCWAGGYVYSDKPWDASWDDHKDLDGPTRNSAAISNSAYEMTVTGLHFFNVHDGARSNDAYTWLVQHSWGEYVRDDCIENDHLHSGRVFDVLFDGCYTGISTRPSSDDTESNGAGQLVELDRVLLRMQPMPYPYKWQDKSGVIGADGQPYSGSGVPYGHGNIFKLDNDNVARNPHFSIRNSVFLVTHYTTESKLDFPPPSLIDACQNNTIIWLGGGSYPGELPTSKFPSCFTVLTGQKGIDYWVSLVTDWHARHPGVDAARKPVSPGSLEFPRVF